MFLKKIGTNLQSKDPEESKCKLMQCQCQCQCCVCEDTDDVAARPEQLLMLLIELPIVSLSPWLLSS